MSKYSNSAGKPLSGLASLNPSLTASVADSVISDINSGNTVFTNVTITGGQIDGAIIGNNNAVTINATTITSGTPGTGYSVCFFGNIIGDSACWMPVSGTWNIQGDLIVRDISDLGNLRILTNTIRSTNTNGNINLTTNGTGLLNINSGINQNTISGNISLNSTTGDYSLNSKNITSTSTIDTNINSGNGNINLTTGTSIQNFNISFISTGSSSITVTTTSIHNFYIGQRVIITGSNSTPNINGSFIISSISSSVTFVIPITTPVTSIGTTGLVRPDTSIYLNSYDSVYIPSNTPLIFGDTVSLYYNDINSNFNIDSQNTIINGNLTVNGTSTLINSTVVTIDDPVFNVGGTDTYVVPDIMDRGVSFHYYNSGNKIGFFGRNNITGCFTYIPDAVETNNVYTGTPGCATFGTLNVSSINTCNLTCSGNLSITGTTSTTFTTPTAIFSGNISSVSLNTCNITCSNNLSITGTTSTTFTTPTANFTGNVNVSGTLATNNLSVTGNITGISLTQVQLKEHLNITSATSVSPTANTNITFINITSTGVSTGTLLPPNTDGFEKKIMISSMVSGGSYRLYCPVGVLLDPVTGSTIAKYLDFNFAGQSVYLIWDNIKLCYITLAASVCSYA
jgi:hypothetical protein